MHLKWMKCTSGCKMPIDYAYLLFISSFPLTYDEEQTKLDSLKKVLIESFKPTGTWTDLMEKFDTINQNQNKHFTWWKDDEIVFH
jgi:hypothetical protein